MPSDYPRLRYLLPKLSKGSYSALMKTIKNSFSFDTSDAAKFRLHVLEFYYAHGWRATVDAFGIGKSTLYDWKRSYETSGRKLVSLVPFSTRPHHTRMMTTDPRLVEFIKALREKYGSISKYKIKPFLDEYAKEIGVNSYSTGKIGKIIKRKRFFFDKGTKLQTKRKRPLTPRVRKAPKEKIPGYIEMDSITIWVLSRRYYFVTAIDILTKYAWCKLAKSLSSRQALSAYLEFEEKYQEKIRVVQTDNGSEFFGEFDKVLQDKKIKHEFIYPRSPKINGVVERFNQTIQVEFIRRNDEYMYDEDRFNEKLTNYLIWYNTKRPHYSLNFETPVRYMRKFT